MTRVGALFECTPEGIWVGTCPSVAGAFAQGRSIAECRRKLRAAIHSLLEVAPAGDLEDLVDGEATTVRAELLDVVVPDRDDELISQAEISRTAQVTRRVREDDAGRHADPRPWVGSPDSLARLECPAFVTLVLDVLHPHEAEEGAHEHCRGEADEPQAMVRPSASGCFNYITDRSHSLSGPADEHALDRLPGVAGERGPWPGPD